MTAGFDFSQLIPHQGGMCLLEHVMYWDLQSIVLTTSTHRSLHNPLRNGGHLRSVHLCEYGAQAMAVHGALKSQAAGTRAPPGVLVSLRAVSLHCDYIDELLESLEVRADCLQATDSSLQYSFSVRHQQQLLAEGRAAVVLGQV